MRSLLNRNGIHSLTWEKRKLKQKSKNKNWVNYVQNSFFFFLQHVYIVGGHISHDQTDRGNVFSIPSNEFAEFNMFLDPLAAKLVLESALNIILIPLSIQRSVASFSKILESLRLTKRTPEAVFTRRLLSRLYRLQNVHSRYQHMVKSFITKNQFWTKLNGT